MSIAPLRPARALAFVLPLLAALASLALPASAPAAAETSRSFEAEATANYEVSQQCADGTTARFFVTVIGGREEETQSGITTESEFLTVRIRSFADCDGNFVNDFGTGPGEFTFSPSLQEASVEGTVTTRLGRTVTVDMSWEGTGPLEATSNTTTFPGFTGHFQGMRRDAVATGTVVVDGETLVDGSTTNARIETLEDRNTTTGAAE